MVWMGVYTQTFMPPISAQNARILEQTKLARKGRTGPFIADEEAARALRFAGANLEASRPSPAEVANAR
jgi:hypothetical protein